MNLKLIRIIGLFGLLVFSSCNSSNKQQQQHLDSSKRIAINNPEQIKQISEVITRFARAYLSQDQAKINALIHPEQGIAIIHRPGAADRYTIVDAIDFKHPVPSYYAYETFSNEQVLTFESLPSYDCGKEQWEKIGFFTDTTKNSGTQLLETIAKFLDEYEQIAYDEAIKSKINALETGSYRVILALQDHHLIFHVKQFEEIWYVTILDRAYASCDA
ncbi:hypothetical protein ACFRAE_05855 [Sphingobacterium sp. HJSM2_6]|uniref:hypothetical protein n=1 Tax=Sphingobacterium sp. HJSM2_6 TaxID=3366264 RepID=UPI003BCF79E9